MTVAKSFGQISMLISVQPKALASTVAFKSTVSATTTLATAALAKVADSTKTKFAFDRFDFRTIKEGLFLRTNNNQFNDELPRSTAKFSPFEELSGIASSRPEILSISEFKPLFKQDNSGFTSAGEFLDAQVKLMNLRHEAVASLINDLKKDSQLAEQLDQIEGDFLQHVKDLKSNADFLASLQKYIERLSKLFDLRDSGTRVDAATLLGQYYSSVYSNIATAKATLPIFTYIDLLGQHGFGKNNVLGFSSTKIFLQTLFESKKILKAGSDQLMSVDPSLALRDSDASTINRRAYKDTHVLLGNTGVDFPSFSDVTAARIHESDVRLTSYLQRLESGFRGIDSVYTGASSEEVAYTLKLRTLAREASYSKILVDPTVASILSQYGHTINVNAGNQQLFDAVYGQLGERITDDRTGVNSNSLSSIASRFIDNTAVLTYEIDYLEDDQGSVFTPGAAFYVGSTVRPSDNGFSIDRAAELVTRLSTVVDKYVDFVGKFNLLPRVGNIVVSRNGEQQVAFDASSMTNVLYNIFVENTNGFLKDDVVDNPIVDLFAEAATHPQLRANLHVYFCCVANIAGDGLADAASARSNAGVDLRQEAQNAAATAENTNAYVSPTVDKVIRNCVNYYQQITNDSTAATKVENALKNFNEQGPLARAISYTLTLNNVYKSYMTTSTTMYSSITDNMMIALVLQSVLDTARRYAYTRTRVNLATQINTNFGAATPASAKLIKAVTTQHVTTPQAVAIMNDTMARVTTTHAILPQTTVAVKSPMLSISYYNSKLPLKQAVLARMTREDELMINTVLAPLNAVRVVRDGLKDYVMYLQRSESVKVINDVLSIVGDRKLVELLGDRGQVQLLFNTVESVLEKINPGSSTNASTTDLTDVVSLTRAADPSEDLKIFDDSFVTSKTANVLKAVFSNAKYDIAHGTNVRVITFGLPHGFTAKMKNKFKLTNFAEQVRSKQKQNTVVIADVYKVDVRYPDLVFKPLSRVFELSRFPSRDEQSFTQVSVGDTLDTALSAVPTRDYSDFDSPKSIMGVNGLNGNVDYDFMSDSDRKDMLRNHVTSYMFELYFRLLTGIPLSERELYISDPDDADRPVPFVVRAVLDNLADKTYLTPPPPGPPPFIIPTSTTTTATKFVGRAKVPATPVDGKLYAKIEDNQKYFNSVTSHVAVVAPLKTKKTVYTDLAVAGKYMMSPKLFERVFFVDVDPDDFEIDRDETFKSPAGRSSFTQLQQAGEVEVTTETIAYDSRDTFKLKDHSTEKQMVFEKYFVTVRSYTPLSTRST